MSRYIIQKIAEPEELGAAYAESLETLPGEEETLMETPEGVLKVREIPEGEEDRQVEKLRSRGHIVAVEPDYDASRPEPVEVQAHQATAAQARAFHGIDKLWEMGHRGRGQRIAVIDTGISRTLDESLGSRVVYKGSAISGEDSYDKEGGHGTWCISAIARACPEAEIVSIKGLSAETGSGSYSGIIKCVEKARELNCTVISLSLGGPVSSTLDTAVNAADAAGAIVAAAAGNDQRGKTTHEADNHSPGQAQGVLCTAAVDKNSQIGDFSSWGAVVDIAAIGVAVEAEDIAGRFWNGTSMATPYVAALAVLVRSAGFGKAPAKQALLTGCRDTSQPAYMEGNGIADGPAALAKLAPAPEPPKESPKRLSKTRFDALGVRAIDRLGDEVVITVRGNDWRTTRKV